MPARFLWLVLFVALLCVPTRAMATVFLSEVQVAGIKASDEFIELYNSGDESINLSRWSLRRKSASDITTTGSSLKTFGTNDTIPARGYFLWANSTSIFNDIADTTTSSNLADNNSLALYDKSGALIDSLTWGVGHTLPYSPTLFGNSENGEAFIRDLSLLTWSKTKSTSPTNAKGNVFEGPSPSTPLAEIGPSPYQILINEIMPNPQEKGDAGEYIEFFNPGSAAVDLSGWEIHDASTTGKYVFPNGRNIPALGYLVITDQEFSLSLNNSNETLTLSDQEKRLVHQVKYEKTKEGVALNLVGSVLRGARKPTPGTANSDNANPVTKERVPKKGYLGFAIEFQARGKDQDGDKLKFTWDFGDGHKSYKENTSHKYLKSGHYTIILTTDDGIDTTRERFEIKIEKYRAPKIRIVSFVPNPKGNDSELEWIEIENREKNEINLKGFSIATGTKKKTLANHPIRVDFIIAPKSVKRLTREHSLFTLGNVRSHIELRSPDGKVVQHLKYKYEKSLADDTLLKKEKGSSFIAITPAITPTVEKDTGLAIEQPNQEIETTSIAPEQSFDPILPSTHPDDGTKEEDASLTPVQDTPPNEEPTETSSEVSRFTSLRSLASIAPFTWDFSDVFGDGTPRLTYWGQKLNTFLNDWLTRSSVAQRESE